MKRILVAVSTLVLSISFGMTVPAQASASAVVLPQTYTITASAEHLFAPDQITVHVGQPVELKFVGVSGVHSVQSDTLGIPMTMITPGSTKIVTFTAHKAGTYTLHCGIPCGPGHAKMQIVINVTA